VRNAVNLFLSGLFDLEGSVSQEGYIVIYNVSYELLIYVQELLKRFGIETTEPSSNVDLCNNPCYIYLSCFPLFGSFCFSSPCLLAGLEATRTSIALSGSRSRGSERNWETTRGGEEYPYPPPLVPWSFVHSYLWIRQWAPNFKAPVYKDIAREGIRTPVKRLCRPPPSRSATRAPVPISHHAIKT
jgi:hypothetical protein